MSFVVGSIRFADLVAAAADFDPSRVRTIAEERIAEFVRPRSPAVHDAKHELQAAIDRTLMAHYGAWIAGWRWATSEPGGGGPVHAWCCASHSLLRDREEPAASVDRVVAAVSEWRDFVLELAARFEELRAETKALEPSEAVERAAARVLPLVVERTGAQDAWYSTFATVMAWYLESAGWDPRRAAEATERVASGHFHSWITPNASDAQAAVSELGELALEPGPEPGDALFAWLAIRGTAFVNASWRRAPRRALRDGHRFFIEERERLRDPARATRMGRALTECRKAARRHQPLTWTRLAKLQATVLGKPEPRFRKGIAHAKDGREFYGLTAEAEARFSECLAQASDASIPATVRAARVYLDVCFFHPFEDGNARAARLALDYVLTSAGLLLEAVEPIFVVARAAGDARGAWSLAYVVDYLAASG